VSIVHDVSWRGRRGIHFNGFALGASAQASGDAGLQKHVAYMLVADVEDLVDFSAVVTCACAKPDLI
jgi:hypothetical protein